MSLYSDLYETLVRKLHRLDLAGRGDSAEAEGLCVLMEGPWRRMSRAEQRAARELMSRLNAELRERRGERV